MTTPITRDIEDEDIEKTALNQPATNLAMLYGLKLLRQEMGAMKRELIDHRTDDKEIHGKFDTRIQSCENKQQGFALQIVGEQGERKGNIRLWNSIISVGSMIIAACAAAAAIWKK